MFAATEVRAAGRGGLAAVSRLTGLARSTIERGLKDLDAPLLARGRSTREWPRRLGPPALPWRRGPASAAIVVLPEQPPEKLLPTSAVLRCWILMSLLMRSLIQTEVGFHALAFGAFGSLWSCGRSAPASAAMYRFTLQWVLPSRRQTSPQTVQTFPTATAPMADVRQFTQKHFR